MVPKVRGRITVTVNLTNSNGENKPIKFVVENVNESEFEPSKVEITGINEHNINDYSGAIVRKTADFNADVVFLYDNRYFY